MSPSKNSDRESLSVSGKELAQLVGESYSTIDYWSKMGVLSFRKVGNRRLYERESAKRQCRVIRERQNEGLNLAAIKRELGGGS